MGWLKRLFRDDDGATAVEYAVMLALILVVCIVAIQAVGKNTSDLWDANQGEIGKALNASSS